MAAMDFPNSPSVGQEYTVDNRTWRWDGEKWLSVSAASLTDNYVSDVVAGTGVTVSHTPSEGSTATVSIGQNVGTSASVQFVQVTTSGDITVGGNLLVSGSTVTLNTETLEVEDNIILLNRGVAGEPSLNAGIEIERGSSDNVQIRWNEDTDTWQFTNDGTTYEDFGTGVGGALVSASAPATPEEGSLWFDSSSTKTYVYYDSSWVEIGGASGILSNNIDGGVPSSLYGGGSGIDGGGVS